MTPEQILSEEVFTIHACPGADRLAECSRQTAFRDSAADLIADTEFHAETVAALREGVRRRTATFENTERDRLAWRDRAWKAESERDAALAEVERLIADGQQDVPVVDDETREDVLDAVRHAKDTLTEVAVRYPSWGSELRLAGRTLDALAAAYLGRTDD